METTQSSLTQTDISNNKDLTYGDLAIIVMVIAVVVLIASFFIDNGKK